MWFCCLLGHDLIHRPGNECPEGLTIMKEYSVDLSTLCHTTVACQESFDEAYEELEQLGRGPEIWPVTKSGSSLRHLCWEWWCCASKKFRVTKLGCISMLQRKSDLWSFSPEVFDNAMPCRGCFQTVRWVWYRAACLSPQDWETGGCSSAAVLRAENATRSPAESFGPWKYDSEGKELVWTCMN